MAVSLTVRHEQWPIAGAGFAISRGNKTMAEVVVVELADRARGRGECVPYARYGESVAGVVSTLLRMREHLSRGAGREELQTIMPAGAARNAIDCAFWDLEAKQRGQPIHTLVGIPPLRAVRTAFTISLGSVSAMAEAAAGSAGYPLLKIKLGSHGTKERLAAVRTAAPSSALIVDANEAWNADNLLENLAACAEVGVLLVEQPLPQGADHLLGSVARSIPVCADESCHDRTSLNTLASRYDGINIKLDKTGGLTEALALLTEAERRGLTVMVGCMVATSLAIAPACLLAQRAQFVDLDGPLFLTQDRLDALRYQGTMLHPPTARLWG